MEVASNHHGCRLQRRQLSLEIRSTAASEIPENLLQGDLIFSFASSLCMHVEPSVAPSVLVTAAVSLLLQKNFGTFQSALLPLWIERQVSVAQTGAVDGVCSSDRRDVRTPKSSALSMATDRFRFISSFVTVSKSKTHELCSQSSSVHSFLWPSLTQSGGEKHRFVFLYASGFGNHMRHKNRLHT